MDANLNTEGMEIKATSIIERFMQIQKGRNLYELNIADIIFDIKKELPELRNIKVKTPAEDVQLDTDKVIVLGNVSVEIQKV